MRLVPQELQARPDLWVPPDLKEIPESWGQQGQRGLSVRRDLRDRKESLVRLELQALLARRAQLEQLALREQLEQPGQPDRQECCFVEPIRRP